MRDVATTVAWLVLSIAWLLGPIWVEVSHNTIFWRPSGFWSSASPCIAVFVAALIPAAMLVPTTRSRMARSLMYAVPLLVLIFALLGLPAETGSEIMPRSPSPIWYRYGRTALLALPALVVAIATLRSRRST